MCGYFFCLVGAGSRSHSALTNILNQAEVFFKKALRFQGVERVRPSLNHSLPSVGRSFHQIAEYSLSIQSEHIEVINIADADLWH